MDPARGQDASSSTTPEQPLNLSDSSSVGLSFGPSSDSVHTWTDLGSPTEPGSPDGPASGQLAGPYLSAFWVRLGFPLRSKSNFRRHARLADSGAWARFQAFERSVSTAVLAARPLDWLLPDPPGDLPSRPVVVAAIAARSTVDPGNYPKSILDALEGVLYHSDAQVAACACVGVRSRHDQDVVLCFAQLPAGVPALQSAEALALLLPQSLRLL